MTDLLDRYQRKSRRRRRHAQRNHQRLDIQGLRMVAVLTVFANHLWGWPRGGFVGVDVFFVISGFLITGNLLRMAETKGTVSFRKFYWNRVRRIVPAATVVLILTYLASTLVFQPFRAHQVGVDALFAFIFFANWHFAIQGTDYFNPGAAVSPIQHYWSLSIEEQFYFVWPALIFLISVVVVRRAWNHARRMAIAGVVMALIVAASLAWALHETASAQTWAYFNTFARVWELGIGALLAIGAGALASIPQALKPLLSWLGLALTAASLWLIIDDAPGFPAPWALLPVVGAALVIVAGVGEEPRWLEFLRNPVSTYVGDISYSLYLLHWPVIVLVGALIDPNIYYYVVVLGLTFGLSIASYHLVENPLRRADAEKFRDLRSRIRKRRFWPARSSQYAAVGALSLLLIALIGYAMQPIKPPTEPPLLTAAAPDDNPAEAVSPQQLPPLAAALNDEITAALKAKDWPQFNPSADSVINGPIATPEVFLCGAPQPPPDEKCTWGNGPTRAVMIGDSTAMAYLGPIRDMALNGQLQLHNEAEYLCYFINKPIASEDADLAAACPARKQRAVDYINSTKPDVVFITHSYTPKRLADSKQVMSANQWGDSLRTFIDTFKGSVKKIVLIAPPPPDPDVYIGDCYGKRSNTPADCISKITHNWRETAQAERDVAKAVGGVWIDPLPWFCAFNRLCPSFVGDTLTKRDVVHMTPEYGHKITPVMSESFTAAGVFN
jgi:peptidoglycan/LPS O-acetylase OafA/YrhL